MKQYQFLFVAGVAIIGIAISPLFSRSDVNAQVLENRIQIPDVTSLSLERKVSKAKAFACASLKGLESESLLGAQVSFYTPTRGRFLGSHGVKISFVVRGTYHKDKDEEVVDRVTVIFFNQPVRDTAQENKPVDNIVHRETISLRQIGETAKWIANGVRVE